ncbi:MAG: hypothetical protein NT096_06390 [Proteobacteria bacterium]|nr:hypothetical protein [Pseudomonadota bacterium]
MMVHSIEERETTYYVCSGCGYVSDGLLPDECPICGAKKERLRKFEQVTIKLNGVLLCVHRSDLLGVELSE